MALPFDYATPLSTPQAGKPHVAIIGAGVSGLGATWELSKTHQVTLYESRSRLGGHARTIMAGPDHNIPVDTGFMVFNDKTYPHLLRLFAELDIPSVATSMSFAVSLDEGRFEYALTNIGRVLAQKRNAISPRFWRLMRDILHFNAHALDRATDPDMTLADLVISLELGEDFRTRYLHPLAGAIWSATRRDIDAFPAGACTAFFRNHGLLAARNGPKWRTVSGGSQVYVNRLEALLKSRGVTIRTSSDVQAVGRTPAPWVKVSGADRTQYDHLVLATHADQTRAILSDPTAAEAQLLSSVRYRSNRVYLHSDTTQMPKRRNAWSCWVFKGASDPAQPSGAFTYWMNQLQHIDMKTPLFVTLNPTHPIDPALIHDQTELSHPQFDMSALKAQSALPAIQGLQDTWYCGAWTRYGFHEDGLMSGVEAAAQIKARTPAFA